MSLELIHGDSRGVMKNLAEEGELVDCVLSDPPYGIDYTSKVHGRIANDDKPPLWCVQLMADVPKPNGRVCIFTSMKVEDQWTEALVEAHGCERWTRKRSANLAVTNRKTCLGGIGGLLSKPACSPR